MDAAGLDADLPDVDRRARDAARDEERDRTDENPDPRKRRGLERVAQVSADGNGRRDGEVGQRQDGGADHGGEQVDRPDGPARNPDDPARESASLGSGREAGAAGCPCRSDRLPQLRSPSISVRRA